MIFQAIAYGYLSADRPHLNLVADKVRTGSSRQRRFGDIDCYYGLDLEISMEVKDTAITLQNISKELGEFHRNVIGNNIGGIAFVYQIDDDARESLEEKGVKVLSQEEILNIIAYWDWPKQDRAVHAILHYISHIEQDTNAVNRLLTFIKGIDAHHDSLAYLEDDREQEAEKSREECTETEAESSK